MIEFMTLKGIVEIKFNVKKSKVKNPVRY